MSLNIMQEDGILQVFDRRNLELLNRMADLENSVSQLDKRAAQTEQSRATPDTYGLAKVTDATNVTQKDSGLVLGAWQNNAGMTGSLANRVAALESIKERSCVIKSSKASWMCAGIQDLNDVDGVRIHLLNNGMHLISGLFSVTDLDAFSAAINSGGLIMRFPEEYAFANNVSPTQTWSGVMISTTSARTFPIRIPSGAANLFLWGHSAATLIENAAYQLFAIY